MKSKIYALFIFASLAFGAVANAQCAVSTPTVTVNGLSINVTANGTGAGTPLYVWNWGDSSNPGTMQSDSHTYANAGTYQVCVVYADQNNPFTCNDSSCVMVTVNATGINDPSVTPTLSVNAMPNPFSSTVNITLLLNKQESVEVNVYDITGKKVTTLQNGLMAGGSNVINWTPTGLPEGIYFLQVKSGDILVTKKIIYTGN